MSKYYTIKYNMNEPTNAKIWTPQHSDYCIGVQVVRNNEPISLDSIKLFDGENEITTDKESKNGYKIWNRQSGEPTSRILTIKVIENNQTIQKFNLQETSTDSTVWEIENEGGSEYELPIASSTTLGGVKVGENLSIDENGVLSADSEEYELPIASPSTLGGIKVGENLSITSDGTLNAEVEEYELPKASSTTLGGVKVGNGLGIDGNGVLSANGYELPKASSTTLGGMKVGNGLSIATDGKLSVNELPVSILSGTYDDDTTFEISAYVKQ